MDVVFLTGLSQLRGKLSQSEVARRLNISKSYLSLIESGKRRLSLDLAEKMAEEYEVNIEVVLHAYKVGKR